MQISSLWRRLTETISSDRAREVIGIVLEEGVVIDPKRDPIKIVAHVYTRATKEVLEKLYKECCGIAKVFVVDLFDDDAPVQELVPFLEDAWPGDDHMDFAITINPSPAI
ncbi:hypothetical protein BSKO_02439 [Bryopsis sp. KO-2023]|nr:hypothetical protein BSKO_02439 [Bryopsis sp. KO-2023]